MTHSLLNQIVSKIHAIHIFEILNHAETEQFIDLKVLMTALSKSDNFTLVIILSSDYARPYLSEELLKYVMEIINEQYIHYLFYEQALVQFITYDMIKFAVDKSVYNADSIIICEYMSHLVDKDLVKCVISKHPNICHSIFENDHIYSNILDSELLEYAIVKSMNPMNLITRRSFQRHMNKNIVLASLSCCEDIEIYSIFSNENVRDYLDAECVLKAIDRAHSVDIYRIMEYFQTHHGLSDAIVRCGIGKIFNNIHICKLLDSIEISRDTFLQAIEKILNLNTIIELFSKYPQFVDIESVNMAISNLRGHDICELVKNDIVKSGLSSDNIRLAILRCNAEEVKSILNHELVVPFVDEEVKWLASTIFE